MRIYLDVCCLNRPFDDRSQLRIRLETEAIATIFDQIQDGIWHHVSSEMAVIEIDAIGSADRRGRVRALLPDSQSLLRLTEDVLQRSSELEAFGFETADGVHIAAAEKLKADVMITCDDKLSRKARRHRSRLHVRVANPVEWVEEMGHDADA
jgi:hypothetical protein